LDDRVFPRGQDVKTDLKARQLYQQLSRAYQTWIGTLAAGVLVSTLTWLAALWPESGQVRSVPLSVERVSPTGELLIVRRRAEGTEVLTSAADGSLIWARAVPVRAK
jgi:hypothetical protein